MIEVSCRSLCGEGLEKAAIRITIANIFAAGRSGCPAQLTSEIIPQTAGYQHFSIQMFQWMEKIFSFLSICSVAEI